MKIKILKESRPHILDTTIRRKPSFEDIESTAKKIYKRYKAKKINITRMKAELFSLVLAFLKTGDEYSKKRNEEIVRIVTTKIKRSLDEFESGLYDSIFGKHFPVD